MLVLIFSDIHGSLSLVDDFIDHFNPDRIFGLGDFEVSEFDLEFRNIVGVQGNSYFDPDYPIDRFIEIEGIKILLTHGHTHNVRGGISTLKQFAISNNVNVVFYGHTHVAHISEIDNLIIINPGSATIPYSPSYRTMVLMEINEKDISFKLIQAETYNVVKELKIDKNKWKN